MLTVAITGRSGSGKSSVSAYYASLGYPVADGDLISREITEPGSPALEQLATLFGNDIVQEDGRLNRALLAKRAFATEQSNQQLVSITHPAIVDKLLSARDKACEQGAKLYFVDGAMIIGQPFEPYCDKIIVVTCPQKISLQRIINRDKIDIATAQKRLDAQLSEQEMRQAASYIIENDGSKESLFQKAEQVLQQLLHVDK